MKGKRREGGRGREGVRFRQRQRHRLRRGANLVNKEGWEPIAEWKEMMGLPSPRRKKEGKRMYFCHALEQEDSSSRVRPQGS